MVKLKKIGTGFYWFVTGILILFAIMTIWSAYEMPGGYRLYSVQSGSMEPAIKTGSIVLSARQKTYRTKDIITFSASENATNNVTTITHRVFAVNTANGISTYTTKGDANQAEDREIISQTHILGKVLVTIPYIGYAVAFAKTQLGLIILIVIPGTIIVYNEFLSIKREILKMMTKGKKSA